MGSTASHDPQQNSAAEWEVVTSSSMDFVASKDGYHEETNGVYEQRLSYKL